MTSVYPGALDTFATSHITGETILAATDNDQADAINKIEGELGINPSGAAATVLARLVALDAALALSPPPDVGDIKITARSSAPSLWLMCNGASLLRAGTYAPLFAAIGTAYGSVDGTHFTIPDGVGRAPVGSGTGSGLAAKTLGAKVGSEPSNMPSHTHTPTLVDAQTGFVGAVGLNQDAAFDFGNTWGFQNRAPVATTAAGSGSATDGNVPPSFVVNYLIYAGV